MLVREDAAFCWRRDESLQPVCDSAISSLGPKIQTFDACECLNYGLMACKE